jgi:hypothetical protein
MRTSLFVVACSLTAVFACGGSRNTTKSESETRSENTAKSTVVDKSINIDSSSQTNIAVWDNETILEIYGDDISVNRYDGSDTVPLASLVETKPEGAVVVSLTHGKLLVSGNVKRITHKSKGKDSAAGKIFSVDNNDVKITSETTETTETSTKTKETTKEPLNIPWLAIGFLGAILGLAIYLFRKAFL